MGCLGARHLILSGTFSIVVILIERRALWGLIRRGLATI
jgi:hypothetical protein